MFEDPLFASDNLFMISGILLILLVLVQLSFWVGGSVGSFLADRKQFQVNLEILQEKLEAARLETAVAEGDAGWKGLRTFVVSRLQKETEGITSIYLTPQDRRPLPFFRPGQHVTFSIDLPGEQQPVVRCYSLSNAPNAEFYRCTIKRIPASAKLPDGPAGKISGLFNEKLEEGDLVKIKSPAGNFHLDLNSNQPVILLAGGIGITPIYSMLASIVSHQPHRRVVIFYGGKNSTDHAFKNELRSIAARHRNVHLINCYSNPGEQDRQGVDFDIRGRVTPGLVRSTLPSSNFEFYLCGPASFLSSLIEGLEDWGVPRERIHHETFGRSSMQKLTTRKAQGNQATGGCTIRFSRSDVEVEWKEECETILDVAEAAGVQMDSGCRVGNCGTCQVGILQGRIRYQQDPGSAPEDDNVLSCVALPDGNVELDA